MNVFDIIGPVMIGPPVPILPVRCGWVVWHGKFWARQR